MHGILSELEIVLELQHTEAIKSAVEAGLGGLCQLWIALAEAFGYKTLVLLLLPATFTAPSMCSCTSRSTRARTCASCSNSSVSAGLRSWRGYMPLLGHFISTVVHASGCMSCSPDAAAASESARFAAVSEAQLGTSTEAKAATSAFKHALSSLTVAVQVASDRSH